MQAVDELADSHIPSHSMSQTKMDFPHAGVGLSKISSS
jgi:hypothetical protein